MSDLILEITASYNTLERKIEVDEITGLYNDLNNINGWGDPNLEKAAVVNANLTVLKNRYRYDSIDVLETLQASGADEDFRLADIEVKEDGVYVLKYIINDDQNMADHFTVFVNEDLKIFASKLWAELALNHDIYSRKDLEIECHWLEMTLLGLDAVANRGKEDSWLRLYETARIRCQNNKNIFNLKF